MSGRPRQEIDDGPAVSTVALLGGDHVGLRPALAVQEGDRVRQGQALWTDKDAPSVCYTAPGSGEIVAINRGARRALQSVVVRLDGDDAESFDAFAPDQLATLARDAVRRNLLASGLWTAFRTRPFSRIPAPGAVPGAIFVTAIDTNPLAPDPQVIVADAGDAFAHGLDVVSRLTDGPVYVCTAPDAGIEAGSNEQLRFAEFSGPHPAGLPGTHIHFLHPVDERMTVWHLGYQDVIAIGRLFTSGRLPEERVVALAGPMVRQPRLIRTRLGAATGDLVAGELADGKVRVISGSVLSGHRAVGPLAALGRYHAQLTVLREGSEREFLAWMRPGNNKYSAGRAFSGHLLHRGDFALNTSQNGSPRAMVPIGSFDRVMPLDILPTPLLKAILVRDIERASELGCLELDEEDIALCSFVCNGKYEYGPFLRETLDELDPEAQ